MTMPLHVGHTVGNVWSVEGALWWLAAGATVGTTAVIVRGLAAEARTPLISLESWRRDGDAWVFRIRIDRPMQGDWHAIGADDRAVSLVVEVLTSPWLELRSPPDPGFDPRALVFRPAAGGAEERIPVGGIT